MMNAFKAYFELQSQKLNQKDLGNESNILLLPKNYNLKLNLNSHIDIQRLK